MKQILGRHLEEDIKKRRKDGRKRLTTPPWCCWKNIWAWFCCDGWAALVADCCCCCWMFNCWSLSGLLTDDFGVAWLICCCCCGCWPWLVDCCGCAGFGSSATFDITNRESLLLELSDGVGIFCEGAWTFCPGAACVNCCWTVVGDCRTASE